MATLVKNVKNAGDCASIAIDALTAKYHSEECYDDDFKAKEVLQRIKRLRPIVLAAKHSHPLSDITLSSQDILDLFDEV
jgi:hypothetical protein